MLKLKLPYFGHLMWRTPWKRPWCWERLRAGEGEDNRGWDVWMASPTQWTWVWVYSRSLWWTGWPGVLWFMGSQRVKHDQVTELNWNEDKIIHSHKTKSQTFSSSLRVIANVLRPQPSWNQVDNVDSQSTTQLSHYHPIRRRSTSSSGTLLPSSFPSIKAKILPQIKIIL